MPFRSLAFLFYFFGSSTAALVYPMVGLVCYMVIYHLYPGTTWWGKPLAPLGIRYAFICGTCLLIGAAINSGRMKFGRKFLYPAEIAAIAVYLVMLLTLATGMGTNTKTFMLIDKMGKVILFVLVMSHLLVTRQRLWTFTLLMTAMALYLGHEAKNAPPSAFFKNRLDGIGGPDFRESAGLAIHLCALMPFVAIVLWQKRWSLRIFAFLAAGYGINAILLCRARSAIVACAVAGLVALWYAPRRFRMWIAGSLVLASAGGFFLSDQWFWKRMDTIVVAGEEQRDESAAVRLEIWAAAWEMLKANPMGVGVGQFHLQVKRYSTELQNKSRDAHNSFVLCTGELGVPGLIAYLCTLGFSWQTLNRASRRSRLRLADRDFYDWFILANRLGLVVYITAGMFVSRFYTEGMWWLIILPVGLLRAIESEIRQEAREETYIRAGIQEWTEGLRPALPRLGGIR